jgi:LPS-assembly protein
MLARQGQVVSRHRKRVRRRDIAVVRFVLAGFALGLFVGWAAPARAQYRVSPSAQKSAPVLLNADEVNYDDQLAIVTARGHVEISQGDRVLRADVVSYNRQTNVVSATGNISLMEPTGEVIFADYMELSDDMREGVVQDFRMLLADQSRMAAVSARRADGNTTVARRAVYSPCDLCKQDPTQPPIWQIKAARITHDAAEKEIRYSDAWMEIAGVPILYTPYLSHPDGTVPRRSGFLAPAYLSSSITGPQIITPYYVVVGDSADVTLEPMFFSQQEYPLLGSTYRVKTATGDLTGSASVTQLDSSEDSIHPGTRGHVKANGRFDIDDDWRWGVQAERATDRDYLQRYRLMSRYQFPSSTTLTSDLYTEGFRNRSYAAANAYAFQGLRQTDVTGLSPIVLPTLDYNYVSDPGEYGGHYSFDANALSIYRTHGTQDQRGVLREAWTLPYVAPDGQIYTLTASLREDFYHTSTLGDMQDPFAPSADGAKVRGVPELGMGWRYPFIRRDGDLRTIVEPIVYATAAPVYGNQGAFPNEDSRAVDFDVTNLFRMNRFDGYDRVEGGEHVSYGVNTTFIRNTRGRAAVFLGQSYRLQEGSPFPTGSGLDTQSSNYVGRVLFEPHPWVTSRYSFQLDRASFAPVRETATVSVGPSALRISLNYIFVDARTQPSLTTGNIEQVGGVIDSRLSPHWRVQGRYLTSLSSADAGALAWGGTLFYEDECLVIGLDMTRRFTGTRDAPPDTAFVLRLVFRNLGEVATNVF